MKKFFVSVVALCAVCSLSAQELSSVAEDAVNAYNAKNFAAAAENFEKVIAEGSENEEFVETVNQAKSLLPKCYFQLGGRAVQAKDYDKALTNFEKSVAKAEEFGDVTQAGKANQWVARVYSIKGGEAFNSKDYATAAEAFAKGYAVNPRDTDMALKLAMSYCEAGEYEKGMEVYEAVAAMPAEKYGEAVASANEMMAQYTNNEVAKMQGENNFDGIIAMADNLLAKNPANAVAHKVRLQAYGSKKEYAKVIELGEEAAAAQVDEDDRSMVYYTLGAAYNAREMKPQAIAAFSKVTSGPAQEPAKAALTELKK